MSQSTTRNYINQSGTSNKFYNISLNAQAGGWVVLTHYGRMGTTGTNRVLQTVTSYSIAYATFEAACNKRLARGYTLAGVSDNNPNSVPLATPMVRQALPAAKLEQLARFNSRTVHSIEVNPMSLFL